MMKLERSYLGRFLFLFITHKLYLKYTVTLEQYESVILNSLNKKEPCLN